MKLLQESQFKLGWRYSAAIAFFMAVPAAHPGFLNLQELVKFQDSDVAKIRDREEKAVLLENQTVIERHLTNLAAIDHDDDDIGRKGGGQSG
jgi:hypothetical protein